MAKARKRAGGPSGRPRRPTPRETRSRRAAAPAERDRRALTLRIALVVTAVVVGWLLFVRAPGPGTISQAALAAADAAGCSDLERPVVANPVRSHLAPGEGYDYPDPPPASGPHDPTPLPADGPASAVGLPGLDLTRAGGHDRAVVHPGLPRDDERARGTPRAARPGVRG